MNIPIVYVSTMYPSYSETFVASEMAALAATGTPVLAYSLRKPPRGLPRDTPYLVPPRSWAGMGGWFLLAVVASLFPAYRIRLRREPGASYGIRGIFVIAHGLRLRTAVARRTAGDFLVHAHFLARPAEVARVATIARGKSMVTVHASDANVPESDENDRFLSHFAVFRCASRTVRNTLCAQRPTLPSVVIPCVVRFGSTDTRRVDASADAIPTIVTVARLVSTKGYHEMMQVCDEIAVAAGRPWRWIVVGDGPLRTELTSWARSREGLLEVQILGALHHEETLQVLQTADVFMLLSRASEEPGVGHGDGIPVALMEAMHAGVPVVTTNAGGIPELVIHQETGFIVEPGEPAAVAQVLLDVVESPSTAIRERARDHLYSTFAPTVTVPNLHDTIASIVTEAPGT